MKDGKRVAGPETPILLSGGRWLTFQRWRAAAERDKAFQDIKDALAEIDAIGVQVKDLDIGLLDFPCALGDEIVLLCWNMARTKLSSGMAGRGLPWP